MEGKIEIGTKSKQLYDKMRKSHLRGVEKYVHRIKQRNDKTENLILRLVMCAPWKCQKKLKLYKYRVARYVRTKIEQVCKQGKKRANKQVNRFLD